MNKLYKATIKSSHLADYLISRIEEQNFLSNELFIMNSLTKFIDFYKEIYEPDPNAFFADLLVHQFGDLSTLSEDYFETEEELNEYVQQMDLIKIVFDYEFYVGVEDFTSILDTFELVFAELENR